MISVVIPLFNEQESLAILHGEIATVLQTHGLDAEIIFVDDGSTDRSWEELKTLAAKDPRVRAIRFRRNFGKAAALTAGFRASRGEMICTMDADLQDDPKELPRFLQGIDAGADLVCGWKVRRQDPVGKTLPSKVFNFLVNRLSGLRLHDHNCGMKCYRAPVIREIRLYGDFHRFIPVLANARGFKIAELAIDHRPRKFGHSKYGVRRFVRGFTDLLTVIFITGFGKRPQHLLGGIGLFVFLAGAIALTVLSVEWVIRLWNPEAFPPLSSRPLLLYAVAALLFGSQMLSLSLLSSLFNASDSSVRQDDTYAVAEEAGSRPA